MRVQRDGHIDPLLLESWGCRLVMELKSAVLADLKILKGNTVSIEVFLSTVEGIHASFS